MCRVSERKRSGREEKKMKIIISPAKKMNVNTDVLAYRELPVFLDQTEILMQWIQNLSYEEAKKLWACNDKIAEQNYERFQNMNLREGLTPAILSYEGIQYQYMAPIVFEGKEMEYIQQHLRILSGFYGVLKPFDGVTPYRLEMQAKVKEVFETRDLYEFWGNRLYHEVCDEDHIILNLASKEYSKIMEKYLGTEDQFVTCIFGEMVNGKIQQKGTMAKMARGEMVRYMAENQIEDVKEIQKFHRLGYVYHEELSGEKEYVFLKEGE